MCNWHDKILRFLLYISVWDSGFYYGIVNKSWRQMDKEDNPLINLPISWELVPVDGIYQQITTITWLHSNHLIVEYTWSDCLITLRVRDCETENDIKTINDSVMVQPKQYNSFVSSEKLVKELKLFWVGVSGVSYQLSHQHLSETNWDLKIEDVSEINLFIQWKKKKSNPSSITITCWNPYNDN